MAGAGAPSGEGSAGGVGGGGEDDDGAAVAAAAVAGFVAAGLALVFERAAGGFLAAGLCICAAGSSSAKTGFGEMTVVGAVPASPDCSEPPSFTAMRTGTLCG